MGQRDSLFFGLISLILFFIEYTLYYLKIPPIIVRYVMLSSGGIACYAILLGSKELLDDKRRLRPIIGIMLGLFVIIVISMATQTGILQYMYN